MGRQRDRQSQHQQHSTSYDMYAEARRYVVTRYVISGIVSSLISLPLVVIGVLIVIDVWNPGSVASISFISSLN